MSHARRAGDWDRLTRFADLLRALRRRNRPVPIAAAEVLLLVGAGLDNINDLRDAMGDGAEPMPQATLNRLVSLLRGRARYAQGEWIESPFTLLEVRPHPHQRGLQLSLSAEGQRLIDACLGARSPRADSYGSDCITHAERTP